MEGIAGISDHIFEVLGMNVIWATGNSYYWTCDLIEKVADSNRYFAFKFGSKKLEADIHISPVPVGKVHSKAKKKNKTWQNKKILL